MSQQEPELFIPSQNAKFGADDSTCVSSILESNWQWLQMMELSGDVFWLFDPVDRSYVYINSNYERVWGSPRESLYLDPASLFAAVHPDDRDNFACEYGDLLQREGQGEWEIRVILPTGLVSWLYVKITPMGNLEKNITNPQNHIVRNFSNSSTHDLQSCRPDNRILGIVKDISQYKRAELRLEEHKKHLEDRKKRLEREITDIREREERFRQIAENVREVFFLMSAKSNEILYINPAYETVWGRSRESLYDNPQSWLLAIHPEDSLEALATLETQFRTGEEFEEEYRIIRPDGTIRWIWARAFPVRNEEGSVNRFVGIAEDITERKGAEEAMRNSEEQFRLMFEKAPIGMTIANLKGKFERVNQSLCDVLGYKNEELLHLNFDTIVHKEDLPESQKLRSCLLAGEESDAQMEVRFLAKNGKIIDAIWQMVVIRDDWGEPLHFNNQIVDITARKQMESQLRHDALHDILTGLPNRALFIDRLDRQLKKGLKNENYLFAVLFLDLDRFKLVNDSVGHAIGDKLLIELGNRLLDCVRPTDTVARLGGDEFTILLENIKGLNDAKEVADRIYRSLEVPFNVEGYELFTTASIGIALSSEGYESPADILRDADATMYSAKEQGKARYEVFNKSLHELAVKRLSLETDLRRGIERQEFCVYYQPITSLATGRLEGFEALARWQHPEKGLISPAEFIPIAEETGLIILLGKWLLQEACQQLKTWQDKYTGYEHLKMGVNLSGKQLLESDLIVQIDRILKETGLPSKNLKLEVTESVLMENLELATEMLLKLRERNIQLSIDDFGTGYSSLSYLHRFPVNTLKIDRSFINEIQPNNNNSAIVKVIVTLAHMLNMDVIAEGIETDSQLLELKSLQCEQGQGYLFAKPLSSKEAEALLSNLTQW
jgi:diguanylate cyclase (GGDEF)-like protein/PAS domain S-box-containing protein